MSADKIVAAQRTITQQVDKELVVRGPAIAETLKSITEQAHQSGNANASYSAGVAQAQYLEMRVNVTRYLSDPSPATAKLAKDNLLDLEDGMNVLFEKLEGSDLERHADKVILELVAYDKAFDTVIAATNVRNREVDRTLRVTGPALASNAERIVQAINNRAGRRNAGRTGDVAGAVMIALLASAAGIAVALFAGALTQRLIAQPITQMAERMRPLAAGDLAIEITGTTRTDEVGDMARAVEIFRAHAREVDERRSAALEAERRETREGAGAGARTGSRSRPGRGRTDARPCWRWPTGFEASVRHVVESVGASARQIEDARPPGFRHRRAERTIDRGRGRRRRAGERKFDDRRERDGGNVAVHRGSVPANWRGGEGRAGSVRPGAVDRCDRRQSHRGHQDHRGRRRADRRCGSANQFAGAQCDHRGQPRGRRRQGLRGRRQRDQDSGRPDSASATQEIASKIARTRDTSGLAATAITDIAKTIDEISSIATVVACAMEQQKLTTAQIAESTSQAAHGSHNVARNIDQVHEGVGATGRAAQESLRAADDLNRQAETLKGAVDSFLATVRAA